ncbi:MAG: arylamine N-acetyltransferase [Acidobacteria bacterium]|nr:arylamine N-acetyltransferase [Acidobacteriota bacterium]
MDAKKYLGRLGLENAALPPTLESLELLQRRHLLTVPFENLDIHRKREIVLDPARFYEKIVGEKRGGFCYELNGLFFELLAALGFSGRLISARVFGGRGFGPEYDHLAILVGIGGAEYLADVGFGDFAAAPLKFELDAEQPDANGVFMIRRAFDDYFEVVKKTGAEWRSQYIFRDTPRALAEFAGMCEFHQTSPESHFTRGRLCSLMLENGRKTLTEGRFIQTINGAKTETEIASAGEFERVLAREFGIAF